MLYLVVPFQTEYIKYETAEHVREMNINKMILCYMPSHTI